MTYSRCIVGSGIVDACQREVYMEHCLPAAPLYHYSGCCCHFSPIVLALSEVRGDSQIRLAATTE